MNPIQFSGQFLHIGLNKEGEAPRVGGISEAALHKICLDINKTHGMFVSMEILEQKKGVDFFTSGDPLQEAHPYGGERYAEVSIMKDRVPATAEGKALVDRADMDFLRKVSRAGAAIFHPTYKPNAYHNTPGFNVFVPGPDLRWDVTRQRYTRPRYA